MTTADTVETTDPDLEQVRENLLYRLESGIPLWQNKERFEHILERCVVPWRHLSN